MKKLISIITPTFNEEKNIADLTREISFHMQNLNYDYEHIIIDNSSVDNTQNIIRDICSKDKRVKAIFNRKNFGHIRSPHYAFLQAKGDSVIVICSDFQEPPSLIVELIRKWEQGSSIVLLKRRSSKSIFLMEFLRVQFYKIINLFAEIRLIEKTTGTGLFDKKIVDEIKKINEPYPYFRGLISEITDKIDIVEFDQNQRRFGKSGNNYYTLLDMAALALIKHSRKPLRFMTIFGFFFSLISFLIGIFYLIYKILFWYTFNPGIAPILILFFFGNSLIILMLGLVGEYIGFTLIQVRNLPLVFEQERINFDN
jgi:glycosyltransferase involved in cell wall biosynthesis